MILGHNVLHCWTWGSKYRIKFLTWIFFIAKISPSTSRINKSRYSIVRKNLPLHIRKFELTVLKNKDFLLIILLAQSNLYILDIHLPYHINDPTSSHSTNSQTTFHYPLDIPTFELKKAPSVWLITPYHTPVLINHNGDQA